MGCWDVGVLGCWGVGDVGVVGWYCGKRVVPNVQRVTALMHRSSQPLVPLVLPKAARDPNVGGPEAGGEGMHRDVDAAAVREAHGVDDLGWG